MDEIKGTYFVKESPIVEFIENDYILADIYIQEIYIPSRKAVLKSIPNQFLYMFNTFDQLQAEHSKTNYYGSTSMYFHPAQP